MKTPRIACVIGTAIVVFPVSAQPMTDDFESASPGNFPAEQWGDMFDRAERTSSNPTMLVIETTGADGEPTLAAQSVRAHGTNGFYLDVEHAEIHELTMDVRVDALATPGTGWPVGVGFSRYSGAGDINANPHAVIYSWTDRNWNLFIAPGEGRPAVDERIIGPRLIVGRWYTAYISMNTVTGAFVAEIRDAVTGETLNSVSHQYTGWDADVDRFNSIVFFDGDSDNSPAQGQATVDNVVYQTSEVCDVDLVADGDLNFFDVAHFLAAFSAEHEDADFDQDGTFDFFDVSAFLTAFAAGCP